MLLGVDIGTTHCKAALLTHAGALVSVAVRHTPARRASAGFAYYDPEELWGAVAAALAETLAARPEGEAVSAVGVASMAETGLLVERATGAARTPLIPWFDQAAAPQAAQLRAARSPLESLVYTGQQPSFKTGLAKLLWLRAAQQARVAGAVWLSVADFIILRLTGAYVTDYSLAGRAGALDLAALAWDAAWLREWDLDPASFPQLLPPGTVAGRTSAEAQAATGLPVGVPVAHAGHDHVAAAFAAGAARPDVVFDSLGTAETLVGGFAARPLGEAELASGLAYGHHVLPGTLYWMGGLSAAGGSVEWARALLGDPALTYADLNALAAESDAPTGLLYFPYLVGSGTPHADGAVRGALVGLSAAHGRAALARAVFEGAAFELEFIRRAAEGALGRPMALVRAAGGGTRSAAWMQIKADVSNCRYEVPALAEATLLGAALVAGWAAGVYAGPEAALAAVSTGPVSVITPRAEQHAAYARLYLHGYLPLQAPLRALARELAQ